jgi:hypothetical protein
MEFEHFLLVSVKADCSGKRWEVKIKARESYAKISG